MMKYWMLKTEKETYSIDELKRADVTGWEGLRNFQARNNLKDMSNGDIALIYHSGDEKAIVGEAEIVKKAYADKTAPNSDWVAVDVVFKKKFKNKVELQEIKSTKKLS